MSYGFVVILIMHINEVKALNYLRSLDYLVPNAHLITDFQMNNISQVHTLNLHLDTIVAYR